MSLMKIIGLTGGIASGKSTVSDYLSTNWNIEIIDADLISRQVVEPNQPAYEKIVKAFGKEILNKDQTLDRDKLGKIIFEFPEKRKLLNDCTHPFIIQKMIQKVVWAYFRGSKWIILDVPLLFEGKLHSFTTFNILVFCSEELQLERLMKRNKQLSREDALQRIKSQMPLRNKIALADYTVDNSESLQQTFHQIDLIMKKEEPSPLAHYLLWLGPLIIFSLTSFYFFWVLNKS